MSTNETHLQMIQSVIARMAQNSFALKGWAVALISAIFALSANDTNTHVALVAYLPAVVFWALDSYYLLQERLFRRLYDSVRMLHAGAADTTDFSMDIIAPQETAPVDVKKTLTYINCLFSRSEIGFYLPLLILLTVAAWLLGAFAPF